MVTARRTLSPPLDSGSCGHGRSVTAGPGPRVRVTGLLARTAAAAAPRRARALFAAGSGLSVCRVFISKDTGSSPTTQWG